MFDLDESQLITIADLLLSGSTGIPSKDSKSNKDPENASGRARNTRIAATEGRMHNVLGIVINSSFREVPNKRGGSPYCVLDMEILDETCEVSPASKQTLGVRLWGAVTRDHLRHRFIEGSVILLVSVQLKPDTYHKGRLTLQQQSYHNCSISYVLCEDQTLDPTLATAHLKYWFDGGNSSYPHIQLVPQRYPALCTRVSQMRRWASQVLYGSSSLSSLSIPKGGGNHRAFSRYAANLHEAAQVSGRWILDMSVCATVHVLTPIDKTEQSPPITWQLVEKCRARPSAPSTQPSLLLRDTDGVQFRLDMASSAVVQMVENSVSLALESLNFPAAKRVSDEHRAVVPVGAATSKNQTTKKRARTTFVEGGWDDGDAGDADAEGEYPEAEAEEYSQSLSNTGDGATCTIGGDSVQVHTVPLMVLLQSVLVVESSRNIATVIQADKDSRFQTWPANNPKTGDSYGNLRRNACHTQTSQEMHDMHAHAHVNDAPSCSLTHLAALARDRCLRAPQLVAVQCTLQAVQFSRENAARHFPTPPEASPEEEFIQLADLVHVTRQYSKAVSVLPSASATATSTKAAVSVDVTYRDAIVLLGPPPEVAAVSAGIAAGVGTGTGTQSSAHRNADAATSGHGPNPTPTPMDFYCMSAISAASGTTQPAYHQAITSNLHTNMSTSAHTEIPLVRAVIQDEVLMKRLFCNIPAALAAASLTRACWESESAYPRTSTSQERKEYEQLPRYNYARAVCRLSMALMRSCAGTSADFLTQGTPAAAASATASVSSSAATKAAINAHATVEVELLVCPQLDEHGVLVMLDQHRCVVRDIKFMHMHVD